VKGAAAGWVYMQSGAAMALNSFTNGVSTANAKDKKIVWVFLRGALDSLHTVIPTFDPDLNTHRGQLLAPIKDTLLPLQNGFGLHPNLKFMHQLYKQQQMAPIVAVASGYRDRSHFDAQDQMESGLNITNHDNGWLARTASQIKGNGIAISRSVPIALRDANVRAETWYPSSFPEASEDLLDRLSSMYEADPALGSYLQALIAQKENPNMQMREKRRANFSYLAERCGELLSNNKNMQCAMLEMGGWDTHNNQVGRLARQHQTLDDGIKKLRNALGNTWENTLVVITTEFGRTVKVNGTQGTDHGTGSAMFFAGGALAKASTTNLHDKQKKPSHQIVGGEVHGIWPGLAQGLLYENRDLMPTTDVRAWLNKAISAHWHLSASQANAIFPDLSA
jgi:uncharacterized protein (DUF1501 family)